MPGFAEEPTEVKTKKTVTQQVGGLLFDVDEGVKVEQGPGGSVYLKSNREYMQQKFEEIDSRFQSLEQRIVALEGKMGSENSSPTSGISQDQIRKVLTT